MLPNVYFMISSNLADKLLIKNTTLWSGKNYADDYRAESMIFYCNPVQGNLTAYNFPVNETGVFKSIVCNQFVSQTYITINNALYQRIAADSSSPFSAWELKWLFDRINHLKIKYTVAFSSWINRYVAGVGNHFKHSISSRTMKQTYFFLGWCRQSADYQCIINYCILLQRDKRIYYTLFSYSIIICRTCGPIRVYGCLTCFKF